MSLRDRQETASMADDALYVGPSDGVDHHGPSLTKSTIMMVDDEPTTIDVLEVFLQGEGYDRFVRTSDSREALDLLHREKPDVLLLDLMMPNVGGLEILDSMRSDTSLMHIPVLILTSCTDAETKLKALELGATDFLGKPVDPSELALRLRNTLAAKAYQDRLAHLDGLTGLPNRRSFLEHADRALERAQRLQQQCAMLHLDLDRFKQINDTLGHSVGDALLKSVADRLSQCVRATDLVLSPDGQASTSTLSRVGGDEFSLLLVEAASARSAARVAQRILTNLAEPFSLGERDLFVTCSIGIALYPDDGDTAELLLQHANVAMSHAKHSGRNDYHFYNEQNDAASLERLSLENGLRKAIDRSELELHYQPKIEVSTGRIIGSEALMRWRHPELGLVQPTTFIPIAEETSLIASLGEWALKTACHQNEQWLSAGLSPLRVSVNVSNKQFRRGDRLLHAIRSALEMSGMDAEHLVLELTESVIMENPGDVADLLRQMKEMGLSISVDDFGTGYSSLGALKRFPLDELKIDRSFVKGIPGDGDSVAIVDAIIAMAHSLSLTVVAEGVETEEQFAFLKDRGCDECQGFLFSKPVPPAAWADVIRGRTSES